MKRKHPIFVVRKKIVINFHLPSHSLRFALFSILFSRGCVVIVCVWVGATIQCVFHVNNKKIEWSNGGEQNHQDSLIRCTESDIPNRTEKKKQKRNRKVEKKKNEKNGEGVTQRFSVSIFFHCWWSSYALAYTRRAVYRTIKKKMLEGKWAAVELPVVFFLRFYLLLYLFFVSPFHLCIWVFRF